MTHELFQELLAEHRASGVSQKRYCEQRGVSYSTFQYWQRKTKADGQARNTGFLRLMPVTLDIEPIEIRFPSGVVISVRPGFDPELLRNIAAALGN